MNEKEIIRLVMQTKGYTQTAFAEKAGMKHQSNVSEILRRQNLRVDNFVRLLNVLDCDLVVVDRESGTEWKVEA